MNNLYVQKMIGVNGIVKRINAILKKYYNAPIKRLNRHVQRSVLFADGIQTVLALHIVHNAKNY